MKKSTTMMAAAISALNTVITYSGEAMDSMADVMKDVEFKPNPKFSRSKYVGWNPRRGRTYFPNAKHDRSKARNLRKIEAHNFKKVLFGDRVGPMFVPIKITPRQEGAFIGWGM